MRREGRGSKVLTIGEMLEQTPEGVTRFFEAPIQGATESRFAFVAFNHEYSYPIEWEEGLPFSDMPRIRARDCDGISLAALPEPEIFATCRMNRLVDFYERNRMFLISNRLRDVFEQLDPGSLECRPVVIRAKDGVINFNLALPTRILEAVDLSRTDVRIKSTQVGKHWVKDVQFPNSVVFCDEELNEIHNFTDIDMPYWLWSRELIAAAKMAGVKGLYAKFPGYGVWDDLDRF